MINKEYYNNLIDRIFNILYIYEENISLFETYVKSLVFELSGNEDFFEIQQIRFRLNALLLNNINHEDVRKTVLKSVNIIDRIIKR